MPHSTRGSSLHQPIDPSTGDPGPEAELPFTDHPGYYANSRYPIHYPSEKVTVGQDRDRRMVC